MTVDDLTPERLAEWREDAQRPQWFGSCCYLAGTEHKHDNSDTRVVALIEALESARDDRDSLRFELDGFRGVARRDNEHLIARAERAEAKLAKVRQIAESLAGRTRPSMYVVGYQLLNVLDEETS